MPLMPGAEPFELEGGRVGVLLVHGFTGSPQGLREWGEHLNAAGLTVSCPRLPGHGTRWQDLQMTRWPDWYNAAERAFDSLRERCDQVFVMALSMGASLSLRLAALRGEEVAGLVLVNPSISTENKQLVLLPVLKHVVKTFPGVANDIKAEGMTELGYDKVPLRAVASVVELWSDVRSRLGLVTQPLLVFRSAEDHVVEASNTRLLLAQVGSSETEERVLANSYHVATLDNDRHEIFAGSLEFVVSHATVDV